MALMQCPECDGKVSDKAQACIHCGYPLSPSKLEANVTSVNDASPVLETDDGFTLFSYDETLVNLECTKCGKVYSYKRELFDSVSDTECVPKAMLACPNCANGDSSAVLKSKSAKEESNDGFWFVGKKDGEKLIECQKCHNVKQIPWLESGNLFNHLSGDNYTHRTNMKCAKCGNMAKVGQALSPKPGAQKSGGGFWGIVAAIVIALLIFSLG